MAVEQQSNKTKIRAALEVGSGNRQDAGLRLPGLDCQLSLPG
jgi:hypothetical protein